MTMSIQNLFNKYLEMLKQKVFFVKYFPFSVTFRNVSYSQKAEDLLLSSLLAGKKGTYVDIGAGLPCWGNNTYKFYRSGWTGTLIDPIPKNVKLAKFFRHRDKVISGAVGLANGTMLFYEFKPYEYSTLSQQVYEKRLLDNSAKFVRIYEVPVITLNHVFQNTEICRPLILSVDTEGTEFDILSSNDWSAFVPDFICIEEWINPINNLTPVRQLLELNGYELVIYNGLSSIYKITP
jgi:FkbM family methyltransferase